ncbi:DUF4974 domain-containing protein [Chitinophaga sp. SYP-B3965]|uniref:FecR family protein n=1 Tax=Chitinophaga sp. SYP-B3965 TaxID=2663120 RepID=UPI001299599A|nr:FecR family protein [Chitinophaga sp. SYP-B3965]MRG48315.1 DUF4974 domain-containing protein [Chitinophaga sp. SYP-B3965]
MERRLQYLLEKYALKNATEAETAEMLQLLKEDFGEKVLADCVARGTVSADEDFPTADWSRIWQGVQSGIKEPAKVYRFRWWAAAAAVLILAGSGIFFFQQSQPTTKIQAKADVSPGKEGAILTLANGTTIVLDDKNDGVVANQQGAKVVLNNGQLAYTKDEATASAIAYNTLSTPKGRLFRIVLPDGSRVWLNAASSLRYPTVFAGSERLVEVSGEAYFEVTHNSEMPFRVKISNGSEVEVLGTHFNINSYKEEGDVNITLLEGAVRCTNGNENAILKPGQQVRIGSHMNVLNDANMEKVMAWKNGIFNFNDATLEEVMRQLERWYDIEVVYEKGVPKLEFIGKMGRDLTLSEVLEGLAMSKVHFRIEQGRRLVILP